jgi:4-hydroxy-3-methylbut-2-enyl diphosphate reductase
MAAKGTTPDKTALKTTKCGFCYGVKRAINLLEKAAAENGTAQCLGELVHNPRVVQELQSKGIEIIRTPAEATAAVTAISAHGVSPEVEAALSDRDGQVLDATCPTVKKVQIAAHRLAREGYYVVIFGDAGHTEVKGLLGWAQGQGVAVKDAAAIPETAGAYPKIGILSQTTQQPEAYLKFVKEVFEILLEQKKELLVLNTICQEVRKRQTETRELARKCDLMLVIGGKNSANSHRLADICGGYCETYLIQNAAELDPAWLNHKKKIGLTSGTSTSQEDVKEVEERIKQLLAEH